jgi:hypothetical protein
VSDQVSDAILQKFLKVIAILILLVSGGCAGVGLFKRVDLSILGWFQLLPFAYGAFVFYISRLRNPLLLIVSGALSLLAGAVVFRFVVVPVLPSVLRGERSGMSSMFFQLGLLYSLPLLASGLGLLLLARRRRSQA